MRRTAIGKRIELTARDIDIFRLLGRYRYLRSSYIHAFVGGASVTRFKERLGDLFHEGYIGRPEAQWAFANCRHVPVIYETAVGARRALTQYGTEYSEGVTWLGQGAQRQFLHSTMICEILASIELGARDAQGLRFVPWLEILAKAPESTRTASHPFRMPNSGDGKGYLSPDALFGLEYQTEGRKTYRFFAVEADRGTMPVVRSSPEQSSYRQKLLTYRDIIDRDLHRARFGIPNLLVLTVTTSDAHKANMMVAMKAVTGTGITGFLFKTIDNGTTTTPQPSLLTEPWARVGHAPLSIATSESASSSVC